MARMEMPCWCMWLVGPSDGREVVRSPTYQGGRYLVWSYDEYVSGTGGSDWWSPERVTCWGGPVGLAWRRGSHGDGVLLGAKPPDRITHDVLQSLVEVEVHFRVLS